MSYLPPESDETKAYRRETYRLTEEGSREPCDCEDCDGQWCGWCFVHHGRSRCPVVTEAEDAILGRLL